MEASENVCHLWRTSLLGLHFMQQQGGALFSHRKAKMQEGSASSIITMIPFLVWHMTISN
jgi:hypothetical protein